MTAKDFINSIDTKLFSKLRGSKGDAECRRLLKEHLKNYGSPFYCQSDIEGRDICFKQCEHCKEYYKPLEK